MTGIDLATAVSFNPALLAGAVVYVLGVVLVTIGGNVPLNDKLAAVQPAAMPAGRWQEYAGPWLRWNHVRAVAGALAAMLLILAMMM